MTNKEAATIVKRIRYYMEGSECWTDAEFIAMDMAVKALEQPEIVRCKDCKHWTETCGDKQWGLGDCDVFDKHLVMCNGYCAWAERREE